MKMGFEPKRMTWQEHNYRTETREFLVAEDLGHTYTLRSSRESLFASLLEVLVVSQSVLRWWYEPHRFDCGVHYNKHRFYTPDFLVVLGDDDIFDTGTRSVWVEVKDKLAQKWVSRQRWFREAHPQCTSILMLDRNYGEGRSASSKSKKTAKEQRALQSKIKKHLDRIIYANDWYKPWGIRL